LANKRRKLTRTPDYVNNAIESPPVNLLIVVADTFEFKDGTLHFAPALPHEVAEQVQLKQGDELELRRPDGTTVRTRLYGLDFLTPSHGRMGLSVNKPLTKADVPVGTEVWKVG
jgi:hypothetical protein